MRTLARNGLIKLQAKERHKINIKLLILLHFSIVPLKKSKLFASFTQCAPSRNWEVLSLFAFYQYHIHIHI